MAEERPRPNGTGERRRLPEFVRRRSFAWAVAVAVISGVAAAVAVVAFIAVVGGYLVSKYMRVGRLDTASDAFVAISFPLEALALLLPAFMVVRWRGIGARARVLGLAACALWMSDSNRTGGSVREPRELAPPTRVVGDMLREPCRAMRAEPAAAVEKALAAGDSSFLAVGGNCGSAPGVDSAVARRQGVRVIRGTYHDTPPLTPEHRGFIFFESSGYAEHHDNALAERLKIEPIPPGGERGGCFDPTPTRGRAPLSWP
jgi:hypothetical protein